ncbi:hypothetical protein H7I42_05835 [Mycolicibacterium vanbaalenii PYR-1]|nr:hypothetical protein [Mycolicibacterium vanbaalenii PYR-1]
MGLIEEESNPDPVEVSALLIDDLDLTVRSYNCLKREGVHFIYELIDLTESDLLNIRNFTPKALDDVKFKLHLVGLSLRDQPRRALPDDVADDWDAHGDRLHRQARRRARRQRRRTMQPKTSGRRARSDTTEDPNPGGDP